jgi:hypothetical protein
VYFRATSTYSKGLRERREKQFPWIKNGYIAYNSLIIKPSKFYIKSFTFCGRYFDKEGLGRGARMDERIVKGLRKDCERVANCRIKVSQRIISASAASCNEGLGK